MKLLIGDVVAHGSCGGSLGDVEPLEDVVTHFVAHGGCCGP